VLICLWVSAMSRKPLPIQGRSAACEQVDASARVRRQIINNEGGPLITGIDAIMLCAGFLVPRTELGQVTCPVSDPQTSKYHHYLLALTKNAS